MFITIQGQSLRQNMMWLKHVFCCKRGGWIIGNFFELYFVHYTLFNCLLAFSATTCTICLQKPGTNPPTICHVIWIALGYANMQFFLVLETNTLFSSILVSSFFHPPHPQSRVCPVPSYSPTSACPDLNSFLNGSMLWENAKSAAVVCFDVHIFYDILPHLLVIRHPTLFLSPQNPTYWL